jgi:hypothetical protein
MAAAAALMVPAHGGDAYWGWRDTDRPASRVFKSLSHPAKPDKKAARKRQKKARAITRRKSR